jgi:putative membrane protein
MNKLVIIATCLLLALPAFAATLGEKTGINSTLGIAPTTKDFVTQAAVSDMFEIQSSKMASAKLTGAQKGFADQMVADHTKTTTELTQAATGVGVPLPTGMDSAHQKMLNTLNGLTGDQFRKEYFSDQVSAHKDAVSLFQRYGNSGENGTLKGWAAKTLPALQHHLDMAQGLYKNT